jgi:hypothetical protein
MSTLADTCARGRPAVATPWSLGAVINGFDRIRDDEGRPMHENRAPAEQKEGIPMRMRRCPYPDERKGKMMNVSALAQITAHLDEVLSDIAGFHASLPPGPPTWDRFCMALMDQLGRPALYVLRSSEPEPTVPAAMATSYKVAAGYLVPTRELMSLALGPGAPEASIRNLIDFVHERRSLVGAREVCAAPMNMVQQVSRAFMLGEPITRDQVDDERVVMARALTLQQWIGLTWRAFDLQLERRLLLTELGGSLLRPRTPHVARILEERRTTVRESEETPRVVPPALLGPSRVRRLSEAMAPAGEVDPWPELTQLVTSLLEYGDGAITLTDTARRAPFSRRFVGYLRALQVFQAEFEGLERDLRGALGFEPTAGVAFEGGFFPAPKSLRWFEMVLGHRLRPAEDGTPGLVLRNQHRTEAVPPAPNPC